MSEFAGAALTAGMAALTFISEPDTWPAFVQWANSICGESTFDMRDREDAQLYARLLGAIADKVDA